MPLTDAQFARIRRDAAIYPALADVLALIHECIASDDYGDCMSAADSAAKAIYDLPDQCALFGIPGQVQEAAE